ISLKRSTLFFSYLQAGRPITPSFGSKADISGVQRLATRRKMYEAPRSPFIVRCPAHRQLSVLNSSYVCCEPRQGQVASVSCFCPFRPCYLPPRRAARRRSVEPISSLHFCSLRRNHRRGVVPGLLFFSCYLQGRILSIPPAAGCNHAALPVTIDSRGQKGENGE